MLPLPLHFIVAMVAFAINERMARRIDYLLEEVRGLREVYTETTGRKGCCQIARPSTILAWFRQLAAKTYDSSTKRERPGRPRKPDEIRELVIRLARENPGWGYTKMHCAFGAPVLSLRP